MVCDLGSATPFKHSKYAGGTPCCMPPQLAEDGIRGPPADVWGLGLVFAWLDRWLSMRQFTERGHHLSKVLHRDRVALNNLTRFCNWVNMEAFKRSRGNDPAAKTSYSMLDTNFRTRIKMHQLHERLIGKERIGQSSDEVVLPCAGKPKDGLSKALSTPPMLLDFDMPKALDSRAYKPLPAPKRTEPLNKLTGAESPESPQGLYLWD